MNNYQPTDAELEILEIIWQWQPVSVRDIHERILQKKEVGYTTVLKQIQRLQEKGILDRDETDSRHRYSTQLTERETKQRLVQKIVQTTFGGSAMQMMMHALGSEKPSESELLELKKWLDAQ
jgi:BlaI family transcriptional regulator, penicillinase repressor